MAIKHPVLVTGSIGTDVVLLRKDAGYISEVSPAGDDTELMWKQVRGGKAFAPPCPQSPATRMCI